MMPTLPGAGAEHPIAMVIDSVYRAGKCPRLLVNAEYAGTVVPEHVRRRWKERLALDLDPAYPMALECDEDGLRATLAFSGTVLRCFLPWGSIYAVVDRAAVEGEAGILFPKNIPESLRAPGPTKTGEPHPEGSQPVEPPTKRFRVIPGGRK